MWIVLGPLVVISAGWLAGWLNDDRTVRVD
jgi:hypothetical protein